MLRKSLYEEGYIIYSETDANAIKDIKYIDRQKAIVTWTHNPAHYKVYKTEAEAIKDLKYVQLTTEEYLKYTSHRCVHTQIEEDDLTALNAMNAIILGNRLSGADVYKVQKSIIVDIEGV